MSIETRVPVRLEGGSVDFLPIATDATPTWLVVFRSRRVAQRLGVEADDDNGDRVAVGAPTLEHALGELMRRHPRMRYDDVLDHMEV